LIYYKSNLYLIVDIVTDTILKLKFRLYSLAHQAEDHEGLCHGAASVVRQLFPLN